MMALNYRPPEIALELLLIITTRGGEGEADDDDEGLCDAPERLNYDSPGCLCPWL